MMSWSDIRILLLTVAIFMLASCAVQPGKQSATEEQAPEPVEEAKPEFIVVEPDIQSAFDKATAHMAAEEFDAAIAVLENLVKREKRLAAPYINLAIAYTKTDDKKKARENIDLALKVDRGNPIASNELGLMLRREGKFEEARKVYLDALEQSPEYLPVIRNLGILCDIYLRDWDCALEQFEKHQDLQPDDQVKIWIADLKRRTGG